MARSKKDGTKVSFLLSNSVLKELEEYCDAKGQPKTTAVERILHKHITEWKERKQTNKTFI